MLFAADIIELVDIIGYAKGQVKTDGDSGGWSGSM